jgi:hypothetical protein
MVKSPLPTREPMDISKLPKLSKTNQAAPSNEQANETASAEPVPPVKEKVIYVEHAMPGGPEAWISLAMGLLFLLMVPTTLTYISSKVFGTTFTPFADPTRPFPAKCDFIQYTDGTRLYYRDMSQFWSDLVITLFAIVLIIDGIIIASRVRNLRVAIAAFVLTILVVAANLFYLVRTFSGGIALMSAVAVAYGIYIAIFQWRLIQILKHRRSASTGA